jgi:aromatic-amino-acid transaminase
VGTATAAPNRCDADLPTAVQRSVRMRRVNEFLVKGDRPGDDPIFSLNQEASARAAKGESIVNASIGVLLHDDGSLAVLSSVSDAVKDLGTGQWASYAPISGPPAFLNAVMDDLFSGRPALRAAATAVATPGGTGAIRHAVATFLEKDQALLTTSFYWSPYATIADEQQRHLATFEMFDPDGNADSIKLESLDRKLGEIIDEQQRALVILNDPCHNPTGYSMTERDWQGAADIITRHADKAPVTVLVDAAYAAYAPGGLSAALGAFEKLLGRALLLVAWSASKSLTAYGMRVGALVALTPDENTRQRVTSALGYACRGTWSNCNHGGMQAAARLLSAPDMRDRVSRERAALAGLLGERVRAFNEAARARGLPYPRYDGGFFVTVFSKDSKKAAEKMKARGVFVVPMRGALRAALCAIPVRDVPRLVDALAEAELG